ncbi:MAG: non-heme iron oxygenase ferredoxin subunit [Carbonactinosporaceae bacterium]
MSEATATWLPACSLGDVPEDGAKRVVLDGTPISVVSSDGEVFAIHDVCSHANVSLSEGEVEDHTIECWLHGSCFDLRTGKPTALPATKPVPVYPVRVEGTGPQATVHVALHGGTDNASDSSDSAANQES